ncbi:MAG: ABC transporter ATP-binding protein [Thermoplasmata archaeon]|jgi:ABC-2 type transport system ATP-binding protein
MTTARVGADPVIHVEGLVKRYHQSPTAAVDGIDLDVYPGELFAFLGPNGAGKTTTISILTTALAKTSGVVRIAGYDLDRQAREIRENIGIIFQDPSLDEHLTAEENVRFHVALYGVYGYRPSYRLMPASYRKRVEELSSILGLGPDMFRLVRGFSGGMKRKLEVLRTLMHPPKVLFLDEPTLGLDAVSRQSLWTHLRRVQREEGTTIFLTTHYIEEAETADRIALVRHGRILFLGSPESMKATMTARYVILDAPDRAALRSELADLHPEVAEDGSLKIPFHEETPQTILSHIRVPLSVLRIHMPTLEEAYVGLVTDGDVEEAAS